MYLLPAVCLCAAVSGAFRAVFAVCYPTLEAVSAFCGGGAAGMGTDSHRKPVCCPASPPLPALLCAGVPAADADFTAQECKCVLGVHPGAEHCRRRTAAQCLHGGNALRHAGLFCKNHSHPVILHFRKKQAGSFSPPAAWSYSFKSSSPVSSSSSSSYSS